MQEVAAQVDLRHLRARQREQVRLPRAAPQEVHPAPLELAPAGAREDEASSLRRDQVVHLVEERRQLLNLVDDDDRRLGRPVEAAIRHDLAQSRRILSQRQVDAAAQEIDDGSRVELLTEQRRLAGAAGTEQKQRLSPGEIPHVQRSRVHATGAYLALRSTSTPEPMIFVGIHRIGRAIICGVRLQRRAILTRWSRTRDSARPWRRRSG